MTDAPAPELTRDAAWQRLDPRMLLVHPIRELIRFFPAVLAVVVFGRGGSGQLWQLLVVAVPVALGLLRYLTTRFRISGGRIELSRGLLSRHTLATPVDRVRTVDLTSSLIHRALGLTTVRIGTGSVSTDHDDQLDLDGLPLARAHELRRELLMSSAEPVVVDSDGDTSAQASTPLPARRPDQDVVRLDASWVRFAPFTGSGLVLLAATFGVISQTLNTVDAFDRIDPSSVARRTGTVPVPALVAGLIVIALIVMSLLAIGGYVVTNWGFHLTRGQGREGDTWHLSRGLFTTRETTVDDERVAGITITEPVGLRLVRGARLLAIVTGLDRQQRSSFALVPPAPRSVVTEVAGRVLGSGLPATGELQRHGPRAVRRRWTRALGPAAVVAAAGVAAALTGVGAWAWAGLLALPVGAALATDRSRNLGHALVAGHLVAGSGSLVRRRRALGVEHVIGWTFHSSWFQRRAGLTTLVATTAGGPQAVLVLDVPEPAAVGLTAEALPGLVDQFRRPDSAHVEG